MKPGAPVTETGSGRQSQKMTQPTAVFKPTIDVIPHCSRARALNSTGVTDGEVAVVRKKNLCACMTVSYLVVPLQRGCNCKSSHFERVLTYHRSKQCQAFVAAPPCYHVFRAASEASAQSKHSCISDLVRPTLC